MGAKVRKNEQEIFQFFNYDYYYYYLKQLWQCWQTLDISNMFMSFFVFKIDINFNLRSKFLKKLQSS